MSGPLPQLQTRPTLLCVLDEGDEYGGRNACDGCAVEGTIGTPIVIDLSALRAQLGSQPAYTPSHRPSGVQISRPHGTHDHASIGASASPAENDDVRRLRRLQPPARRVRAAVSAKLLRALLIEQTGIRVLEAKTWGDALYAVFAFTRWGGIRVAVSRTHEGRQLDVDLAYREIAMCESPCTPDPCFVRTIL